MPNYTKLFSTIVTSTIWTEDDRTRLVWITMLALADKNGEVHASIPGLARVAGVPVEDCEHAIARFLSPDPYSRTKDFEGRRLSEIDGGWELLNFNKYRRLASTADDIEANAKRQQRWRERNANAVTVTERNGRVTPNTRKADSKADTNSNSDILPPSPPKAERDEAFEEFWRAYPRKVGKGNAETAWKKHKCATILPQILVAVRDCKVSKDWTKEGGQFIPHPATWLNRKGWEDEFASGNGALPGEDFMHLVPDEC